MLLRRALQRESSVQHSVSSAPVQCTEAQPPCNSLAAAVCLLDSCSSLLLEQGSLAGHRVSRSEWSACLHLAGHRETTEGCTLARGLLRLAMLPQGTRGLEDQLVEGRDEEEKAPEKDKEKMFEKDKTSRELFKEVGLRRAKGESFTRPNPSSSIKEVVGNGKIPPEAAETLELFCDMWLLYDWPKEYFFIELGDGCKAHPHVALAICWLAQVKKKRPLSEVRALYGIVIQFFASAGPRCVLTILTCVSAQHRQRLMWKIRVPPSVLLQSIDTVARSVTTRQRRGP